MEDLIAEHRAPRPAFPAGTLHSFFKDRGTPSHHTETNIKSSLCARPSSTLAGNTYSSINGTANSIGSADTDPSGAPMPQDSCYCKILVSNHLAGIIIGSSGNEIKNLKQTTGAKIVLSPHGMYFPGTTERLAAIEGSEQAVFQVVDWILEKMSAHAAAPGSSASPASASAAVASPPSLSASPDPLNAAGAEQQPVRPPQCLRICVPRAVVGSLIGKNGGYIQSLRVATGACINISPLFVNADEACAERVVSVESKKKHRLKTAALTLIRKINAHPDKGSCRHVCYYRKHNFLGADLIQQQSQLLPRQQHSQTLDGREGEPPEAQRDELLQQQQTLLQQKPRLQQQSDEQQHHLLSLQPQQQSSGEQPDPKPLKRPQPQHEPEQHAIDALRLRTVSLVLGTAKRDSAALSDGTNGGQFAAFRRFCESRNGVGAVPELAEAAQRVAAEEAAPAAAARISSSKAGETPPPILGASGASAHAKTTMSFESLSTVCSSTTGSTDRLPSIRDITIVAADSHNSAGGAGEGGRVARGSERAAAAAEVGVAPQQAPPAAAADTHELRQLLQLGVLFALLLSVVLHLFVQLFK